VLSAVALGGPVIPESKGSQNRNVDNDVRRMREREMDNRTVTRWEFRAEPKKTRAERHMAGADQDLFLLRLPVL